MRNLFSFMAAITILVVGGILGCSPDIEEDGPDVSLTSAWTDIYEGYDTAPAAPRFYRNAAAMKCMTFELPDIQTSTHGNRENLRQAGLKPGMVQDPMKFVTEYPENYFKGKRRTQFVVSYSTPERRFHYRVHYGWESRSEATVGQHQGETWTAILYLNSTPGEEGHEVFIYPECIYHSQDDYTTKCKYGNTSTFTNGKWVRNNPLNINKLKRDIDALHAKSAKDPKNPINDEVLILGYLNAPFLGLYNRLHDMFINGSDPRLKTKRKDDGKAYDKNDLFDSNGNSIKFTDRWSGGDYIVKKITGMNIMCFNTELPIDWQPDPRNK